MKVLMRTIWRIPLDCKDTQVVRIPGLFLNDEKDAITKAKILTVGIKDGTPHLWVLMDTDAPKTERTVRLIFTGEPCGCPSEEYVGTFVCDGLVYHVFVN